MKEVKVEKIGGTSMSRFGEILDNVICRDPQDLYNRIYIVSAYGGVTNSLLEHKKTGAPGVYQYFVTQGDYEAALDKLEIDLHRLNSSFVPLGLDIVEANEFISDRLATARSFLQNINEVLASGYVSRRELLMACRELLASIGESHSAFNSTNILQNKGIHARCIDLCGWLDSREFTMDERIVNAFADVDPSMNVVFVTGYCKGTEGIMREFDRGYSEVTFSKVAVHLGAVEAIIHKEYHLCSGDPVILGEERVRPICATNFDVADQLADIGMEAIHPKASKPLEKAGISIRVRNAFDPNHEGTLISTSFLSDSTRVEVVTGSNKLSCVEIRDTGMVGEVGFDLRIMQVLEKFNISYVGKSTNANTISVIFAESQCTEDLVKTLRAEFQFVTSFPVAVVCAIGTNMKSPGILARAAGALAERDINILSVTHSTRQTNMQFVVERDKFIAAQRALHEALCE
jgi:aspartate kinase